MLNNIGPYVLAHPEFIPPGETCFITRQPFREEHWIPFDGKLGHKDVWHLFVPLGQMLADPETLEVKATGPFLSFYLYAEALKNEPMQHLEERIIDEKMRLLVKEVAIVIRS